MPEMGADAFLEKLSHGKAVPAILLLGHETYLRDLCRAQIVEAIVPEGARDWGVSRFDAGDDSVDAILGRAQTPALLAPQQVVFVRGVEAWEGLGRGEAREIGRRHSTPISRSPRRSRPWFSRRQPSISA